MLPDLIRRYSAPVPRYTSYPTAPYFSPAIGPQVYETWLRALPSDTKLSLYLHIPFCHELCWYCGCNTKAIRRYEPVRTYVEALLREIALVSQFAGHHRVTHVHWGGGSPNALAPDDIARVGAALRSAFGIAPQAEYAVEIDPRSLSDEQVAAFAAIGINRVSLGVQDFDEEVQQAINRIQSFENTKRAVEMFRAHGVKSINIDLVYGLPHQTRKSVQKTILKVLALDPDRIAIFGYAHLPARLKHQRLIEEKALPGVMERFGQSRRLHRILLAAGYKAVGLDHYAKPTDKLADEEIHRNFQGYTTDSSDALVGLGASAIGNLPQGYVQNAVAAGAYQALVNGGSLATVKGVKLTADDRVRAAVIERLMCGFELSKRELREEFGQDAEPVIADADLLVEADQDGLVMATEDGFKVTDMGKPFVRTICSAFDAYHGQGKAQHALAV
ncbi:MAG TPA: oxygen-independent coproporphyrinogen III oxidase [Hyphomicrobium sp.]|nr:oxygen-independent coproporphyrinogen III oxidase [Hyphomicrobium sp.]